MRTLQESCRLDQDLTFVCMVTLDGKDRRFACNKVADATGGVLILHCPEKSLNVIEAGGFKENLDPTYRLRRSEDYRQPGHKAERQRQRKSSYELRDDHRIIGPTNGSAANALKHEHSTSEHEIVFYVYNAKNKVGNAKEKIYGKTAAHLPELCRQLSNTNPPNLYVGSHNSIMWLCGNEVDLSTEAMLQKDPSVTACFNIFEQARQKGITAGVYHENRIKLGYTSTRAVQYIQDQGSSKPDARQILSTIAAYEATFLEYIENKGLEDIASKFASLGVPCRPDRTMTEHVECTQAECKIRISKTFDAAFDKSGKKKGGGRRQCIVCATRLISKPSQIRAERADTTATVR